MSTNTNSLQTDLTLNEINDFKLDSFRDTKSTYRYIYSNENVARIIIIKFMIYFLHLALGNLYSHSTFVRHIDYICIIVINSNMRSIKLRQSQKRYQHNYHIHDFEIYKCY